MISEYPQFIVECYRIDTGEKVKTKMVFYCESEETLIETFKKQLPSYSILTIERGKHEEKTK
jgi:hypothetical protein